MSAKFEDAELWKRNQLMEILNGFDEKDIYNADETGLFFKELPEKTYAMRGISVNGYKKNVQRVSKLFCCNSIGTNKLIPLVIGHFKKPRCLRSIKCLPVIYNGHRNAWMTREVFSNWIISWDRKLTMEKRKICLLVDNCSAHTFSNKLSAIKL